jgi:hypothetical protein
MRDEGEGRQLHGGVLFYTFCLPLGFEGRKGLAKGEKGESVKKWKR